MKVQIFTRSNRSPLELLYLGGMKLDRKDKRLLRLVRICFAEAAKAITVVAE
jgi:hypothetical protein